MLVKQTCHPHFSPFQRVRASAKFLDCVLRRSPSPALMTDQPNPRQTDKLHILSRNPGPARGLDQRALVYHLNGPCHIVCVQEGSGFVTDNTMQVNFYVVTQHPCAVLLNKDTFKYDISCTLFQVPCSLRYAAWAVQGVAVTDEFRGRPTSRALSLLSRTSSPTKNVLKDVRCASRCCCSSGTRASSSVRLYSLGTSTRWSKGKHHLAMVNAEPLRWKLPSRTFRGLQVALLPCVVPAANPTTKVGLTAAASLSSLSRSHSGSYAMALSTLSRRPSGLKLPSSPGIMNHGFTSSSQDTLQVSGFRFQVSGCRLQ